MPPKPRLVIPAIREFVRSRIGSLSRQRIADKVSFITSLLLRSYLGKNRHEFDLQSPEASTFSSRFLRRHLGGSHADPKTHFPVYQKYLVPLWDFERLNQGYSKADDTTKSYRLREDVLAFFDALWADPASEAYLIDDRSGKPLNPQRFPRNGVCDTSYARVQVPSVISLDIPQLEHTARGLEQEIRTVVKFRRADPTFCLRYLKYARKCAEKVGGIPNLYSDRAPSTGEESSGRLYGLGDLHPQWMPSTVRQALFSGMNLWDYDFRSSQLSVLCSLAHSYGVRTPDIDSYLVNKDSVHLLAKRAVGGAFDAKEVFNALANGAPLSKHRGSATFKLLGGYRAVEQFEQVNEVKGFMSDITKVHKVVLDNAKVHSGMIINAVGKRLSVKSGKTQRLAHIYQGWEAWCLDLVCRDFKDVVCLVFDGWISGQRSSVLDLENLIASRSVKRHRVHLEVRIKERAIP